LTGPAPVLAVEGLSVRLPGGADRPFAVEDLSLEVRPGEIVCVVGESGSGKSVTAQAVMDLLPPDIAVAAGSVRYAGRELLPLSRAERLRLNGRDIAMVFQEPIAALNPFYRVGRQVEEVFRVHGAGDGAERRRRVLALFEEVRLPDPARVFGAYPHQLSGGQCQRVMIAMALALEPRLLIADEPTTALDVTTQAQILSLIRDLRARHGAGVLFITHDFGVVAEIADRIVVMQKGRTVETGTVAAVLGDPRHSYTRALVAAVPRPVPRAPRAATDAQPVLAAEGLRKVFARRSLFGPGRRTTALDGVSMTLAPGETLGLVGESGSGKSTLAQSLLRLVDVEAGAIRLGGDEVTRMGERRFRPLRRRIQIIFQDPWASLDPRQTAVDAIAEGPIIHGVPRSDAMERARRLIALVGLDPQAGDRFPHQFSGGQRQRLCIARALAVEPGILVADEPVSSLDVSVQAQILALLDGLQRRLGFAMLFVTHDLRVAARICDRVAVMHRGKVVETGETAAVFADPRHDYTRTLLAAVPGRAWFDVAGAGSGTAEARA
jgi:peptide/nickel transport system ATP-binding protein